ncbi:MAG: cysteine-rich CWC family protein [Proteobacteria bacterium]|nr:cysteine-rich CWC family protein [Pseudomonadota bacterium]
MLDAQPPPANAACARCGAAFRCGMDDAAPCPCTRIALDARTLAELRDRYVGCLCGRCLAALAERNGTASLPASG